MLLPGLGTCFITDRKFAGSVVLFSCNAAKDDSEDEETKIIFFNYADIRN